jgi:hypothetical protein
MRFTDTSATSPGLKFNRYAAVLGTNEDYAGFDFAGEGPPPDLVPGSFLGARWLDEITGDIYTLMNDGS